MDDLLKRLRFGSLTTMGSHRMNLEAADRIEELEAKLAKSEAEKFTVGTLTMKHVFRPSGLTNVSDMQAVFDATERGFEELEAKLAKAVGGLEELARLGNGDRYGNSFGNLIAQKYIAELTGGKDG